MRNAITDLCVSAVVRYVCDLLHIFHSTEVISVSPNKDSKILVHPSEKLYNLREKNITKFRNARYSPPHQGGAPCNYYWMT